ncbi:polysaccharide deacetylase family protein [Desulfoluna spongiiphila]|uniref:polysaccharide deacetylase family protein n=1 Tax=Desulfoluna spongiiphila TaxID=419481 RepID=UPI00125A58B5|nr:polysaccharide deacetylase family protein [Desulfoluna spongiiphila]VVS95423.1 glycoside hydrolase/deacetylase beta/alpha-barrel [Desulfoluna spongiiphila]
MGLTGVRCVMKGLMGLVLVAMLTGAGASTVCAGGDSAVIFMYHRFGDARFPSTNIRMDQFKEHLAYLEENGFHVAPLDEVVASLKSGDKLPEKTVALTMDDAYASVYEHAWPLLKEKGWPFTVFVGTEGVDKGYNDYMTWGQMRELKKAGVQFANHTATHPHMTEKAPEETEEQWLSRLKADVLKAQERLDEELGTCPRMLAYPYGEYNTKVADLVAELGFIAFGQHSGAAGSTTDFRAAPRFPMSETYGTLRSFRTKSRSLALPVVSMTPWDPETTDRQPELEVFLGPGDALWNELSCYVSGQGRVDIEWVVPGKQFKVRAKEPFSVGRHKYNLTVPAKNRRAYHWFSRQWIVRE